MPTMMEDKVKCLTGKPDFQIGVRNTLLPTPSCSLLPPNLVQVLQLADLAKPTVHLDQKKKKKLYLQINIYLKNLSRYLPLRSTILFFIE